MDRDEILARHTISIHEYKVISGGMHDSLVQRGASLTVIFIVLEMVNEYAGVFLEISDNIGGLLIKAIIGDDDLEILVILISITP